MRLTLKLLVFSMLLLLSSCMAAKDKPKTVILQNPETMDFQNCKVADWGSEEGFQDNEKCIERYQQEGYIIWGSM
jgi:hypothetical protein